MGRVTESHNYNAICDVCGFQYKASEMRKRWDGLMVCKDDYETRHPLDFYRVKNDQHKLQWTRPEPTDTYVTNYERIFENHETTIESTATSGGGDTQNWGTSFTPRVDGYIRGFKFYLTETSMVDLQEYTARLYTVEGLSSCLKEWVFRPPFTKGWNYRVLDLPYPLTAWTTYVLSRWWESKFSVGVPENGSGDADGFQVFTNNTYLIYGRAYNDPDFGSQGNVMPYSPQSTAIPLDILFETDNTPRASDSGAYPDDYYTAPDRSTETRVVTSINDGYGGSNSVLACRFNVPNLPGSGARIVAARYYHPPAEQPFVALIKVYNIVLGAFVQIGTCQFKALPGSWTYFPIALAPYADNEDIWVSIDGLAVGNLMWSSDTLTAQSNLVFELCRTYDSGSWAGDFEDAVWGADLTPGFPLLDLVIETAIIGP